MSHCKTCGSFAINHHLHGRDGSDPDLCDVCYWRKRAEQRKPLTDEEIDAIIKQHLHITDPNLAGAVYMTMRDLEEAHGIRERPTQETPPQHRRTDWSAA